MTTIQDVSTPKIDEPRIIRWKSALVTPALMLTLAAALLTFINVAAAIYTFRSTSNLIEIDTRLGDLKAFEDRVAGQLDAMNNGIQRRLEMLQGNLNGRFGDSRDDTQRTVSPAAAPEDTDIDSPAVEVELAPEPVPEASETLDVGAIEAPPPKRASSPQPVQKSSAYERIQSADGKVYYRKVQ